MRSATVARLLLGGACVAVPARVLGLVGGPDRDDPTTALVVRVLGGRMLLQGAADMVLGRRTRGVDVAVELLHAASMLAAAAWWPDHRRTALASAAAATAIALLDVRSPPPDSLPVGGAPGGDLAAGFA
jgi:hypothetical protein